MLTRLGVLAGFTALFSITLAIVTQARRIEVFAATAASVYPDVITRHFGFQANGFILGLRLFKWSSLGLLMVGKVADMDSMYKVDNRLVSSRTGGPNIAENYTRTLREVGN